MARAVLSLLRRVFCRSQGKAVNQLSRQMTPEEAVELRARLASHGVAVDDDESRDGNTRRERAAR
jgi:type III secretory pathway lipoprotein EscJ